MGLIRQAQEKPDQARAAFSKSIALDPSNGNAHLELAKCLWSEKKLYRAAEHYRAAIRYLPQSATAYEGLARINILEDNAREAISLVEKSVRIDSTRSTSWFTLGQAHQLLGELDRAEKFLRKALALAPSTPTYQQGLFNLGSIFHGDKRFDQARSIYQDVLAINQNFVEAHFNLGILYFNLSQFDRSIAAFKQATLLAPDDPEIHLGLAQAYEQTDQIQKAIQTYQRILTLDRENQVALEGLKRIQQE